MDKNLENSIVIVADAQGALHLFLEGSYALGLINLGKDSAAVSIHQSRRPAPLIVHTLVGQGSDKTTSLQPSVVKLPLLDESTVYNVANVSSAVFALLKYSIRVLNDMVKAWFGTESLEGGRDVGRKWIKVLEEKEMLLDGDGHSCSPLPNTTLIHLYSNENRSHIRTHQSLVHGQDEPRDARLPGWKREAQ